jgi:hypothetical protein
MFACGDDRAAGAVFPLSCFRSVSFGQPRRRECKTVNKFLTKIVAWITAGYPDGVPGPDRVPLFALMRQRLTEDEVKAVTKELTNRGEFDHVDIGVLITQLTDGLPTPADVERVRARLAAKGWPLDDPRDAEETE